VLVAPGVRCLLTAGCSCSGSASRCILPLMPDTMLVSVGGRTSRGTWCASLHKTGHLSNAIFVFVTAPTSKPDAQKRESCPLHKSAHEFGAAWWVYLDIQGGSESCSTGRIASNHRCWQQYWQCAC
jgi:hypothetical protein